MINRLNDFNCFDENDFLKLKMILNKEKTKILNIRQSRESVIRRKTLELLKKIIEDNNINKNYQANLNIEEEV